jgi:hypothetical protein
MDTKGNINFFCVAGIGLGLIRQECKKKSVLSLYLFMAGELTEGLCIGVLKLALEYRSNTA